MSKDVSKALVGIKGTRERRKQMVANRLVAVLLKHLDVSMNKNFPPEGDVQTLTDYFNYIVPPCIEACMTIRRSEILISLQTQENVSFPSIKVKRILFQTRHPVRAGLEYLQSGSIC